MLLLSSVHLFISEVAVREVIKIKWLRSLNKINKQVGMQDLHEARNTSIYRWAGPAVGATRWKEKLYEKQRENDGIVQIRSGFT